MGSAIRHARTLSVALPREDRYENCVYEKYDHVLLLMPVPSS